MSSINRRSLMVGTAAAAATAFLPNRAKASPNERVSLCAVGIRGRGHGVAKRFASLPHAQITHICDVNEPLLGPYGEEIHEVQKSTPRRETDLRRVLDDPSVDGIIVTTPDHWHALATIWACQAGKHVYVEKPISHNVFEGRQMVAAARKYQRHVQDGTQSRSGPHYLEAMEMLRSGKIGKIHLVKAWNSQRRPRADAVPDGPVPQGLDWNIWQGPAPEQPFNANRYTYAWRWMWDYGTGDMGNDGVHDLDIARWGMGVTAPSEIHCTGNNLSYLGSVQETPDTQIVTFRFPDQPCVLVYEQRLWSPYHQEGMENGVIFYGTEGYLMIGRRHWKLVAPRNEVIFDKPVVFSDDPHMQNFINSIREGEKLNCDIEEGYYSTLLSHLGNLAFRVGRTLNYDDAQRTCAGDAEATALLKRSGRNEFTIPDPV